MVVVDDNSLYRRIHSPISWLGLRVGGCLALFYIHHMNRVNSRNDLVVMISAQQHYKCRPHYYYYYYYYALAPNTRGIKRCFYLTSVCRVHRA